MPKLTAVRHHHRYHPVHHRPASGRNLPKSVRLMFAATSARWFGWGFGELLIPLFLFSFAGTYAEAGLFSAVFDIAYLLALPVAGMLADRISGANLFIMGALLYPFIGLGYWLAGITGIALFVVATRLTNGVSYAFDSVARETYIRHHVPQEKISRAFGYFDMVANFWWMAAGVLGIFLLRAGWSVHNLLFIIAPFSIISVVISFRLRHSGLDRIERGFRGALSARTYLEPLRELSRWGWRIQLLAVTNLFLWSAAGVASFFLPIMAVEESHDPVRAVVIGIAYVIPTLFGSSFGKAIDRNKNHAIATGLLGLGCVLILAALAYSFVASILAAFLIGLAIEFVSLASNGLVTLAAPREHFGRISSVMGMMGDVGSLMGPVVLGIIIDASGRFAAFGSIAGIAFLLGIAFFMAGRHYRAAR